VVKWHLICALLISNVLCSTSEAITNSQANVRTGETIQNVLSLLYSKNDVPKVYTESEARTNAYLALASASLMVVLLYRHIGQMCHTVLVLGILYFNIRQMVAYLTHAGRISEDHIKLDERISALLDEPTTQRLQ